MGNHCTLPLANAWGYELGGRVAVTWWLNPVVFRAFFNSRSLRYIYCSMLFVPLPPWLLHSSTTTNPWTSLEMARLASSAKYDGRRMVWYVLLVAPSCSQAHGCFSQIFARKELNFERMSERDRKQIVAEVCVPTHSCIFFTD